jgi:hypothetical protein
MTGIRLDYPFAFMWTTAATQRTGAQVYVYENGTTTLVDVFSDYDLVTPAANPIVSASGIFPTRFIETAQLLTLTLKDTAGNTIATVDDVEPFGGGLTNSSVISGTAPALTFEETDQASPLGRWRWMLSENVFALHRNTAVAGDFSTFAVVISIAVSSVATFTSIATSSLDLSACTITGPVQLPNIAVTNALDAGFRRAPAMSITTGTPVATDSGKRAQLTGSVTIPANVFAVGDILLFYAGSSSRTVTQGAALTMLLDGSGSTGNRTLAAYGACSVIFNSATECVISGSVS